MIFMIGELEELSKKIIRVKLFQGKFFEEAADLINKQTKDSLSFRGYLACSRSRKKPTMTYA